MGLFKTRRSSDLKIPDNRNWMSKLPESVKAKPLSCLSIPGSHDSLTHSLVISSIAGPDQPSNIRKFCKDFPCIAKHILYRWSFTQYKDVSFQLHHGIRYFDIRLVSESVETDEFRVLHCLVGDIVLPALKEMSQFLDNNPGEVLIIDFQHLYQFTAQGHKELVRQILDIFGKKICPCPMDKKISLRSLTDNGHQVIILYPLPITPLFCSRMLCPNPWPNTTSVEFLTLFLEDGLKNRDSHNLFVSQGVMTPNLGTVVLHCFSDLETACSRKCNKTVERWLNSTQQKPNILITDFVFCSPRSSRIIQNIIDLNFK